MNYSISDLVSFTFFQVDINHAAEIDEIFDAISYRKGASVIRMLQSYLGAECFQVDHRISFFDIFDILLDTLDLYSFRRLVSSFMFSVEFQNFLFGYSSKCLILVLVNCYFLNLPLVSAIYFELTINIVMTTSFNQRALAKYIKRYACSNAKTEDLWSVLQEESGEPVNQLMDSWTKQKGYPVVSVTLKDQKLEFEQVILPPNFLLIALLPNCKCSSSQRYTIWPQNLRNL